MVEVFKTNVTEPFHAEILLRLIHTSFNDNSASFDLEDSDKILRVESSNTIDVNKLIKMLHDLGFEIEVLPDELPSHLNGNIHLRKTA